MRLYILCFMLLLSSGYVGAQNVRGANSDEEVARLVVDALEIRPNDFHLTDGNEWKNIYNLNDADIKKIQADTKYANWVKADFNQDGVIDLVVNGYIEQDDNSRKYLILAFVSKNRMEYSLQDVVLPYQSAYPWYFKLIDIPQLRPGLQLTRWIAQEDKEYEIPRQIDTAILLRDYFINYHQNPVGFDDIVAVSYTAKGDVNTRLDIVLDQNKNRKKERWNFTLSDLSKTDRSRPYTGVFDNNIIQQIKQYIGVLDTSIHVFVPFSNSSKSDQSLAITLANGKKITIDGLCVQDDLTLSSIYDLLDRWQQPPSYENNQPYDSGW